MWKKTRKLISMVLVAGMVLSMGMSVMAAKSPNAVGVIGGVVSAVDKNGNNVNVVVKDVSGQYAQAAQSIRNKDTLKDIMGDKYKDTMKVYDIREVAIEGDASQVTFPVTVTLSAPGITPSSKVYVSCYNEATGKWELIDAKAGNGTITVTMNHMGPIAIILDSATVAGTSGSTSPKTGQNSMLPIAMAAIVLFAGAGICLRRREF